MILLGFLELWKILAILGYFQGQVESSPLIFCAVTKRLTRNDTLLQECLKLNSTSVEIKCIVAQDRLTCLRMLSTGQADFAVLEPEDLSAATSHRKLNVLVTHELRKQAGYTTEMILLVKNNHDTSWISKDKKLCYIALDTTRKEKYYYHYTTYLEKRIIPKSCHSEMTILENRMADLSSYFESSCIAGPWSLDTVLDGQLKSKYKNLCALCNNPVGCFEGDRYFGESGAISCLLENFGDMAWVSKNYAMQQFTDLALYGFNLLCPDGQFIPLTENGTRCSWIVEPFPVVVARESMADNVLKIVSNLGNRGKPLYNALYSSHPFSYLQNESSPIKPDDYMKKFVGYLNSRSYISCEPSRGIRWCVGSTFEAKKCDWMSLAAQALDIQPKISCLQQPSRQAALEAVKNKRCDIFLATPEEEMQAKRMNLKPVAHFISNKNVKANRVAAIVKKDSTFNSYKDLKGAKACFTGYKSVGWNSIFSIIRNSSDQVPCSDTHAISEFFKESCVYDFSEKNEGVPKNLYSLCNETGKFDKLLGRDENAFKCLMNGGDVAFVNLSAADKYYSGFSSFDANYKTICDNGDNQNSCFLAETTLGSIVTQTNISQVKEEEIYLVLLSLDRFFGRTFDRETAMFTMYGPFDGVPNVIFPDNTQHLQRHINRVRHGKTYEEILESLQEKVACQTRSSASSFTSNIHLIGFSFLILKHIFDIFYYLEI